MDFLYPKEMEKMRRETPARIGIGHAGPRYTTKAELDFWEAQTRASDAVQMEVPKEVVEQLGVFEVRTKCKNKYEMLTRPDWGRLFEEDAKKKISENCEHHVDVQIYFGDGLCSPSVGANIARTIGPLLDAKLTCVLLGERPGLVTNESMSAYMALDARPEMSESDYKVVSNISRIGMPPVEAAAYIAELMKGELTK